MQGPVPRLLDARFNDLVILWYETCFTNSYRVKVERHYRCRWERVAEIAESLAKNFKIASFENFLINTLCFVLYDMSRRDYKNEKMKLNAGEKLFSTRQILSRESTFLCVNWIDFSSVTVDSL